MHPTHRLTTWVFLSCVLVAGEGVMAQPVAIDLGTLGGPSSEARAVNNAGQVVGSSRTATDDQHAFSWSAAGGMVDLGTLGGRLSYAVAVNDRGQVVGNSSTSGLIPTHAFSWTAGGGMIDLGTLGGESSDAEAVNDNGQVVGFSTTNSGVTHAFSWTADGGMVDLGTVGGTRSVAVAVNDNGQVVGISYTSSETPHAFSWTADGGMVDLGTLGGDGTPGGTYSVAIDLNDHGEVVGYSTISGVGVHASLWTAAEGMIDLGTLPGDRGSLAVAINDGGQVVGHSWSADSRAFSWTADGGMVDLGTPGGNVSDARAVNNNGQVVGSSRVFGGASHAFSWTADGGMIDLGRGSAWAVNDAGQVVGSSDTTGADRATLWVTVPTAPVTTATLTAGFPPSAAGWYRDAVTVALTATDDTGPSGVAHIVYRIGQGPDVVAEGGSVSFTIAAEGEADVAFYAVDQQGNVEEAQTVTVRIDMTPPTITLAAPAPGVHLLQHETVKIEYACVDALSGVASCAGPLPSGASYPTSDLGNFSFVVTASDLAGNTSSAAQNYSVVSPADALGGLVAVLAQFDLQQGIAKSLAVKLQNAMAALTAANAGQRQDARHRLEAALHEIEAQRGKALTHDQASSLTAAIVRIVAAL